MAVLLVGSVRPRGGGGGGGHGVPLERPRTRGAFGTSDVLERPYTAGGGGYTPPPGPPPPSFPCNV